MKLFVFVALLVSVLNIVQDVSAERELYREAVYYDESEPQYSFVETDSDMDAFADTKASVETGVEDQEDVDLDMDMDVDIDLEEELDNPAKPVATPAPAPAPAKPATPAPAKPVAKPAAKPAAKTVTKPKKAAKKTKEEDELDAIIAGDLDKAAKIVAEKEKKTPKSALEKLYHLETSNSTNVNKTAIRAQIAAIKQAQNAKKVNVTLVNEQIEQVEKTYKEKMAQLKNKTKTEAAQRKAKKEAKRKAKLAKKEAKRKAKEAKKQARKAKKEAKRKAKEELKRKAKRKAKKAAKKRKAKNRAFHRKLNNLLNNQTLARLSPEAELAKLKKSGILSARRKRKQVSIHSINRTRGPSKSCPTCQFMNGKPKVDFTKKNNGISFTAGPVGMRVDIDESLLRQIFVVTTGPEEGRYSLALSGMFVTDTVDLVNGQVPTQKVQKYVNFAAKGLDAPYMWDVSTPAHTEGANTDMYKYKIVGTPKNKGPGLLRPTIILQENLLSSENVTTSKFDFNVEEFDNTFWQVQNGNTTLESSYFGVMYTVQKIDKFGRFSNPPKTQTVDAKEMTIVVPSVPVVGKSTTDESISVRGVTIGGLDISGPTTAIAGNGAKKNVIMKVGQHPDGTPAVYFFYPKFETSLNHDPYVIPNRNILPSNSAPIASIAMAFIAVIAAVFMM